MVSCVQYAWLAGRVHLYVDLQPKAYKPGICKRTDLSDLRGGSFDSIFLLKPYSDNLWKLFFFGSLLATTLEYFTAVLMNKIFGEIWWDYTDKPFNYKGILCLESSIAWGFYTIGLFVFLHKFVEGFVNGIPMMAGKALGGFLAVLFTLDFANAFYREKREAFPKQLIRIREGILNRFSR